MLQRISRYLRRTLEKRRERAALARLSAEERALISRIQARKLSYLSATKLASLANTCHAIENGHLPGIVIEAGCALGGSAILIATLKSAARPFYIYDVFGMIPPPTQEDTPEVHDRYQIIARGESKGIDGGKYYGYETDLYGMVHANLVDFGIDCQKRSVSLVKGLVQETMQIDEPVAFAHIDVDWYEPVKTCLQRIFPRLAVHGSIILDDYHVWGGCRKAVDEYLLESGGQYALDDSAGSMKITRLK